MYAIDVTYTFLFNFLGRAASQSLYRKETSNFPKIGLDSTASNRMKLTIPRSTNSSNSGSSKDDSTGQDQVGLYVQTCGYYLSDIFLVEAFTFS